MAKDGAGPRGGTGGAASAAAERTGGMIINIAPEVTVLFLLLFARLGAMVMLMPGLGEQAVPARIRLAVALLLTLIFYPLTAPLLPTGLASDPPRLLLLMGQELLLGLALGLLTRMLMAATQVAGATIAFQIGLSFSQTVDPTMGQQGAIIGSFLAVTGMTMIFLTDLHHVALAGLAGSYRVFPPGEFIPVGDMADAAVRTASEVFAIGVRISAPFIVFGLVFSLGLGVLAKLMPQLQVFFLAMPVTIFVGLVLFALLLITMMTVYLGHLENGLMRLVPR